MQSGCPQPFLDFVRDFGSCASAPDSAGYCCGAACNMQVHSNMFDQCSTGMMHLCMWANGTCACGGVWSQMEGVHLIMHACDCHSMRLAWSRLANAAMG